MNTEIEEEKLKADARKKSIEEGSGYSLMEGFGLRFITPFALKLGTSDTGIGLLNSLPSLVGSISELLAPGFMKNTTRKFLTATFVLFEALMWLTIVGIALLFLTNRISSNSAPTLLIILYTLLITFGTIIQPPWTSWMKDILPERYGAYLGERTRITGFVSITCTLIGGFILDYFAKTKIFYGFVVLFSLAFIGRMISFTMFTKTYEPHYEHPKNLQDGFPHFLKTIWKTNYGHFTAFVSLISFATNIASPFCAVYMLENLHFNLVQYGLVSIISVISTIIFVPVWGKFADMYGNMKVMVISGFFLPFIIFLWYFSSYFTPAVAFPFLLITETFSGIMWSGFNLASGNFVFDAIKREKVASKTAHFQILNNFGAFIGAVLGGIIATIPHAIFGIAAILFIMILSAVARMVVYLFMIPKVREVKHVEGFTLHEAKERMIHLTPISLVRILR